MEANTCLAHGLPLSYECRNCGQLKICTLCYSMDHIKHDVKFQALAGPATAASGYPAAAGLGLWFTGTYRCGYNYPNGYGRGEDWGHLELILNPDKSFTLQELHAYDDGASDASGEEWIMNLSGKYEVLENAPNKAKLKLMAIEGTKRKHYWCTSGKEESAGEDIKDYNVNINGNKLSFAELPRNYAMWTKPESLSGSLTKKI